MFTAIAITLFLLFCIIFFLSYKLIQLIKITKKSVTNQNKKQRSNQKQAYFLLLFIIVGLYMVFWYSYTKFHTYTLPVASKHGVHMDKLFWITTCITGIVFISTQILLFSFAYKYRFQKNRQATYYTGNNTLEIIWTIIPTIILAILTFFGLKLWAVITNPPPQNDNEIEVIEIVGQQFAWKARYPGKSKKLGKYHYRLIDPVNELGIDFSDENSFDDFVTNILYLPKGKSVLFKIRSKDVLHSVYLPHFRVKMDAVPGMPTRFCFVPNKTTEEMRMELNNKNFNYELACAEICGRGHFSMKMIVKVVEQAVYNEWFQMQKPFLYKQPTFLDKVPAHLRKKAEKEIEINVNSYK